jgi:hypothetical protein
MSDIGKLLRDAIKDIALLVFDRAVSAARAKFPSADRLLVTREDIVEAVITLRYEHIALVVSQLDVIRAQGELELQAAQMRARESYGDPAGDHVQTVIVERDGTEPETQPFKKK